MGKLIKVFLLFVLLSGGLVPNIFASEDYYAPNMLIPKKVYQDVTYDVPRMNRVKSNELFGYDIFSRTPYFPLASVIHYPPTMYSHNYLMVTDIIWNRLIISDDSNDWFLSYGEPGAGEEQFMGPHGISTLGSEVFFVTDTYNDRLVYGDVSGDPPVIWWRGTYTGLNYPLDVKILDKPNENYYIYNVRDQFEGKNHTTKSIFMKKGLNNEGISILYLNCCTHS